MALLFNFNSLSSLSSASSSTSGLTASPFFRLCNNSIALQLKSNFGCKIQAPFVHNNRGSVIVKVSSESPTPSSDGNEQKSVPMEKLPLELKLEQKMRMKMAKKIRLRRKRLVRKRHLRKKGRWPPSKLKKNKNV